MKKKRFGQHFLYDHTVLNKIAEVAGIHGHDILVEVGPGHGTLTRKLLERARRVIAIEIDPRLYEEILDTLSEYDNLQLILGDALRFDFRTIGSFKVVSNIPYSITTPLLFNLLGQRPLLQSMTLTMQKEVAERIIARPGNRSYGVLSISVQYVSIPRIEFIIPRTSFRPPPKVDSAVVSFEMLETPAVMLKDEELFFRIVRSAFSQRRKMISNSLKPIHHDIKNILERAGISPDRRPETLNIHEFAEIANSMDKVKKIET